MRAVLRFALLLLFVPPSSAAIVDFTFSGTDSGTIGGTAFSDSAFAIGGQFDTLNLKVIFLDVVSGPDDFTFISIDGVGVFEFATPVTFLDAFIVDLLRLQFTGTSSDAFISAVSEVSILGDYDLSRPFGPVTVTGHIFGWTSAAIETSGGVLVLDDETLPITYQASVVANAPEPSSAFLVWFGIAGAVLLAYRRSYETMHASLPKSS